LCLAETGLCIVELWETTNFNGERFDCDIAFTDHEQINSQRFDLDELLCLFDGKAGWQHVSKLGGGRVCEAVNPSKVMALEGFCGAKFAPRIPVNDRMRML
jgi:hypothetical protein